jgi:transcriptional regulator with XRE-family HTH domain
MSRPLRRNYRPMKKPRLTLRKVFAANLKAAREARGLSQEELAKLAQLYRCRIDTVERGERNIDLDNILRLADALGIEPGELLWKA